MDSNGDEVANTPQRNTLVSQDENKLNLNKRTEDEKSGRELLSKNEKSDEDVNVYKKSQESVESKQAKNEENPKDEKGKTKTEEEKKGEEEDTTEQKNEKDKKKKKKEKLPIIPYKVSGSYQSALIASLKKENKIRPKTLLEPDLDDITRNIGELDLEEKQKNDEQKLEDLNMEEKEREDKTFLSKYKESSLSGNTMLQDPMALFSGARRAYIDQFYRLSDLFVICPLYFNYRISLEYCTSQNQGDTKKKEGKEEYTSYHLFNTKEITPSCSHNCLSNQSRPIDINIFNFILDSKEDDRKIQRFLSIKKKCRCALSCLCACCSRPTFVVETPIEELGQIIELRTVCDPTLNVLNINKDVVYVIKGNCTDCGYCCRDQCCDDRRCATCKFDIYDGSMENSLGTIEKDHRSGKKVKPDYDQLVVTFPESSSCQDRVLLMCSAIVIEYLYFQNMSNTKRCSGEPRFRYAFSK